MGLCHRGHGAIDPFGCDGPGALEARVPVFIDRQLAGSFGQAADWYMAGPHDPGADPDFGYQSPLTPAEIYRESIPIFDAWCEAQHGARFADLPPEIQDAALEALEEDAERSGESLGPAAGEGEEATDQDDEDEDDDDDGGEEAATEGSEADSRAAPIPRILPDDLREFFALLLQNTKEGYFSDPRYGGNHGMAAWVHIGFPGARASFLEWVDQDNVPYRLGPVSIAGERA
jgi:gluconate 2-dehydrogenase gamma chain